METPFDKEIENLRIEYKAIESKIFQKEEERDEFIIKNKLYKTFPLPEEFRNKKIKHLTFVDIEGNTTSEYADEIFEIDKKGYPYYSSLTYGILEYDYKNHCFVRSYFGGCFKEHYVGCFDIEFDTSWEDLKNRLNKGE